MKSLAAEVAKLREENEKYLKQMAESIRAKKMNVQIKPSSPQEARIY